MRNVNTIALVALIVAIVGGYLVFDRFNTPHQPPLHYVTSGNGAQVFTDLARGESVRTEATELVKYQFTTTADDAIVYLDRNTEIRVNETNPGRDLTLIEGRLATAHQPITVHARDLSIVGDTCVVVHYSWLDQADISVPASGGTCTITNTNFAVQPGTTVRVNTFTGELVSTNKFDPATSEAQNFFVFAGYISKP